MKMNAGSVTFTAKFGTTMTRTVSLTPLGKDLLMKHPAIEPNSSMLPSFATGPAPFLIATDYNSLKIIIITYHYSSIRVATFHEQYFIYCICIPTDAMYPIPLNYLDLFTIINLCTEYNLLEFLVLQYCAFMSLHLS
jgi:hypothetical protein